MLKLLVRKWVCPASSCAQRIFAERFPGLVQSYARMTDRLKEALQSVGVTTNGADGACLFARLSMPTTGKTIIRRVIGLPLPADTSVHVAGIDEWAWKKASHYGTILVDLEQRRVAALLPERSEETAAAWFANYRCQSGGSRVTVGRSFVMRQRGERHKPNRLRIAFICNRTWRKPSSASSSGMLMSSKPPPGAFPERPSLFPRRAISPTN